MNATKQHTLFRLIIAKLPRNLVEFVPVAQALEGFLLVAVFGAQDVAHVDGGCGLELAAWADSGLRRREGLGLGFGRHWKRCVYF